MRNGRRTLLSQYISLQCSGARRSYKRLISPPTYGRGGAEVRKRSVLWAYEDLTETLTGEAAQDALRLRKATQKGAWMTVQPSTVNGTELGAQEWQDSLLLRYCLDPPNLPKYCDGCNAVFSICHALDLNRGGLVTACHNDICEWFLDLVGISFTPTHVRDYPLIFAGWYVKSTKVKSYKSKTTPSTHHLESTEHKGDLLIRDLFQNGTDSVHYMRAVNTDTNYYSAKTPEKCRQEA